MELSTLTKNVLTRLQTLNWTLATAESCTGGLLGDVLTNISGSSTTYLGGIIAYSNTVKTQHLGVSEYILQTVGAVSAKTAQAMAFGVQTRFGATVALSTTGIAGPLGGTPEKPVGLVFLGLALPSGVFSEHHVWDGDRKKNKEYSVYRALEWLLDSLNAL